MHKWLIVVLVFISSTLYLWWQWPSHDVSLITCDVGQGDAFLITRGFVQVLIDTGPTGEAVLRCLGTHMPWYDRTLEMIVVTHEDNDHAGGFADVMTQYRVGRVVWHELTREAMGDIEQQANLVVSAGDSWQIGGMVWRVEWPSLQDMQAGGDRNSLSLVLTMSYGELDSWWMADVGVKEEDKLLARAMTSEVVKIGHHGSNTSSSQAWLNALKPEVVLIGVGKENRYGHPDREVMDRIEGIGAQVVRSDEGDAVWRTDGQRLWEVK